MPETIEAKRKEMGLSQDKLAKMIKISRQYYNAIENNKRTPSVDLAKGIAEVLGVSWTIFFEKSVNN